MTGRVLVVDDDQDLCRLVAASLTRKGFAVTWRSSGAEALAVLDRNEVDAVVTDLEMPGMNGVEVCERALAIRPEVPVTVLTGFGRLDTAVAAIRAGAFDFLQKPPEMDALAATVERAVQHRIMRDEVKHLREAVAETQGFGDLLGASSAMQALVDMLTRIAESSASVLITGETGTGKELVARALHRAGRRRTGPFVPVNCAAMPEALLESELFGHVRGAFTSAVTTRPGLFAQANGGTLFLDEIAELPVGLQSKLLRAVQERAIRPVGADVEIACDARVIAATNVELETAMKRGLFREDLYFRLNVIQVHVPPLRARENDVLLLAQHFIDGYAAQSQKAVTRLSQPAAVRLLAYPWPGNVRELQNCIERAVALARYDRIGVEDLPETVRRTASTRGARPGVAALLPLEQIEREHILCVVNAVGGNRTLAAHTLGLDRKTLYRKLARYGRSA